MNALLRRCGLAAAALCCVCWSERARAEPPDDTAESIRGLDDDRFAVRQQSERRLLALGTAALPELRIVRANGSAEASHRAGRIVRGIQRDGVLDGFRRLAEEPRDGRIDLEQGMWLIGRIVDPACDRAAADRRLDDLAARVRSRLSGDVPPRLADPREVVEAVRQVLFVEEGFTGNVADYQNPENSSLDRVLQTGRGLPILLSHAVVAVGRRLDVPLVGLPIPSRYMVKYDGRRAPPGFPREDIVLNPFESGEVLTVAELKRKVTEFGWTLDPAEHLHPAGHRASLERMLSNLMTHLELRGRDEQALLAAECQSLLVESRPRIEREDLESDAVRVLPALERIAPRKR